MPPRRRRHRLVTHGSNNHGKAAKMPEAKGTISFDDFTKLDIRVARVLEVSDHPNANRLLVLKVDLGSEQRQLIAGLKGHCDPQALVGRDLIVVTNLQPRKMRGLESAGMLLAATYEQQGARRVVVLTTDSPVPPGATIS